MQQLGPRQDLAATLAKDDACVAQEHCSLQLLQFRGHGDNSTPDNASMSENSGNSSSMGMDSECVSSRTGHVSWVDDSAAADASKTTQKKLGLRKLVHHRWKLHSSQVARNDTCGKAHKAMLAGGQRDIEHRLLNRTTYMILGS